MTTKLAILDGRNVDTITADREGPRARSPVPEGVFETVLVERNRPRLAAAHATRHIAGCESLGLDVPDVDNLLQVMNDLATRLPGRARLRLMRWRDGSRTRSLTTIGPEPPAPRGGTLVVSDRRRPGNANRYRQKRLDAPDLDVERSRAAQTTDCLDRLLLDEQGIVLEGSKTNVFWRVGRELFTPAASLPILPGVRRTWLLEAANRAGLVVHEIAAPLSRLREADEVMLTNALIRVIRGVELV